MKGKLHSENNYVARSLQMDGGCAPSNAHQKVTSPHDLSCLPIMRRSSISKQTGWHILETVSFFPSHSCLCPMGSWTKWLWSWWQRWGLCMNLTTWTTIPQGWPGYGCYWVPYLPTVETTIKPQIFHHSSGWPFNNLVASLLYWTTFSSKEQCFVLTGVFWLWICLSCT